MSIDDFSLIRRISEQDIEMPCYGAQGCSAGAGEHCTSRLPWKRGEPMLDRTHVYRRRDPITGNLPVIVPTWSGPERRRVRETEIRDDERDQAALRLIIWSNTLAGDDPRRCGVLAAADVLRGQR